MDKNTAGNKDCLCSAVYCSPFAENQMALSYSRVGKVLPNVRSSYITTDQCEVVSAARQVPPAPNTLKENSSWLLPLL
jgi:hypothetical protein